MLSDMWLRLQALFRRKEVEGELDDELRFHLERQAEKYVQSGMTPEEARRRARIELGGVEQTKEECRDARGVRFLETVAQDVRYGLRQLRKSPGFTIVAVLTLALGIGANTAIFSIVKAVFLRPLPYKQANRVFVVDRVNNPVGGYSISMPIYLAWQKEHHLFDQLALMRWGGNVTLGGRAGTEQLLSAGASTELFSLLGVHPAIGRDFLPTEGRPGGANVVILSDGLWRSRFDGDRNILGQTIEVNGKPYTVVGVLPRGFQIPVPGVRDARLWFPIRVPLTSNNPSNGGVLCLGRLKSGVTPAQAAAALTLPLAGLRKQFPKMFGPNEMAHLEPLRSFLAEWAGPAPLLLLGAVGFVLLLACVNLASLSLARWPGRQREIAVRAALGAGRLRTVRQLLTESVLLALLGGLLGLLLCYATFRSVVALVPANLPHVGAFQVDDGVLFFSLVLSVLSGLVFGATPAIAAARVDLNHSLKEGDLRAGSAGWRGLRNALAVGEVGISLVVLIGAALVIESFVGLVRVRPGFDPSQLLTVNASLPPGSYRALAERSAAFGQVLSRLDGLPGVEHAAMINVLPLEGGGDILFNIVGRSAPSAALDADIRVCSPEYFRTMRIPLLKGRAFLPSDNSDGEPVAVINQRMAELYWANQNPIG